MSDLTRFVRLNCRSHCDSILNARSEGPYSELASPTPVLASLAYRATMSVAAAARVAIRTAIFAPGGDDS